MLQKLEEGLRRYSLASKDRRRDTDVELKRRESKKVYRTGEGEGEGE